MWNNRRNFLTSSYIGLGGLALTHLMASESTNPMLLTSA
jgi:hypothetical protein